MKKKKMSINRRQFIKKTGMITAGTAGLLTSPIQGKQPLVSGKEVDGKMAYRRLGRTNLDISVVVAGEMDLDQMNERAYELGVNYWHKVGNFPHPGPSFFDGKDRDSFYCDIVIDTFDTEGILAFFDWGLKQSGLERIDFLKVHSLYSDPKEIKKYGGLFKAFDILKKQKKTRFLSIAQHYKTAEILTACIESGHYDAIQPNFSAFSGQEMFDLIALAKKHDVGVICKKTLAGGDRLWNRRPDRRRELENRIKKGNLTLGQSMLKWALDVPGVTAVVPMMTNFSHLEEDIAVGFMDQTPSDSTQLTEDSDLKVLTDSMTNDYCRSCGKCTDSCPLQVAVPDIFRYETYLVGYGHRVRAKALYHELPAMNRADQCNGCAKCEKACPNQLPIVEKLKEAHSLLT